MITVSIWTKQAQYSQKGNNPIFQLGGPFYFCAFALLSELLPGSLEIALKCPRQRFMYVIGRYSMTERGGCQEGEFYFRLIRIIPMFSTTYYHSRIFPLYSLPQAIPLHPGKSRIRKCRMKKIRLLLFIQSNL